MNLESSTQKQIAKLAGFFYLLIVIFGAFPEKYVRESMIVEPNDALTTASNIIANEKIFRVALVSDLIMMMAYAMLGMTLYTLLKRVNRDVALLMLMFNLLGVPILCLNMLNHFAALHVATEAGYLGVFSAEQLQALSLFFLNMHDKGYIIAQVSTGTWLLPLGYLAYKADFLPNILGILLIAAGLGYLVDLFAQFILPAQANLIEAIALTPSAIGELSFLLYLLIKGVRQQALPLGAISTD